MEVRFQSSPKEVKGMSTDELRSNFLIQQLIQADSLKLVYLMPMEFLYHPPHKPHYHPLRNILLVAH